MPDQPYSTPLAAGSADAPSKCWLEAIWWEKNRLPIWVNRAGFDERPAPEITLATLLPAALACCRLELEERHITPPSDFLLRIVVEEDQKLVRLLNVRYADAAADGGLEAAERAALLDVIARHFTGQQWPRSASMEVTRNFLVELQTAMMAARWKVDLLAVA